MLKKIDNEGRVTLPKKIRKGIGVNRLDEVQVEREGDKIIISNPRSILSREEIEKLYNSAVFFVDQDAYHKGFVDALKIVLKKENDK